MNFRYDINGLRAIAVIPVMLFHFNQNWMPGGFIGVDVFFVISGFLMTGIIFKGFNNNTFSLLKFYVARANRIIPALTALCLFMLIFGWFFLTPHDYQALGKHVAGSMSFLSNVVYWKESGYFDLASHEKWLLHTWSLSVEWQFYIIYPVVLFVLKQFLSIQNLKRILILGAVLGFIVCIIGTLSRPNLAYYLLPTRAWVMMFGGVAYLYPVTLKEGYKKTLEVLGLSLVCLSYILVSKEISWPGYVALIPVLGVYLIIIANRQDSFITNNLIFQYIGKWSYSIYLWHWPIVVYLYIYHQNSYHLLGMMLSIIAGYLSYTFIETIKFNSFTEWKKVFLIKPFYMVVCVSLMGFMVFKFTSDLFQIPTNLYNAMIVDYRTDNNSVFTWKKIKELDKRNDFKNVDNKVLIIGDSQSGDFINAIYSGRLNNDVDVVARIVRAACEVFLVEDKDLKKSFDSNENIKSGLISKEQCQSQINRLDSDPLLTEASIIIISMYWKDSNMPLIIKSIENIRSKNKTAKIFVIGNKSFEKAIPDLLYEAYKKRTDIGEYAFRRINGSNASSLVQNKIFEEQQIKIGYYFVNMTKLLCDNNKCKIINQNNEPFYYDKVHTTRTGAKYIGEMIRTMQILPSELYQ